MKWRIVPNSVSDLSVTGFFLNEKMSRCFCSRHIQSQVFQMKLPLKFLNSVTSRNFKMTDYARLCRHLKCHWTFCNKKMSSSSSKFHENPSSFQMTLFLTFSSALTSSNYKMTDCARFCRELEPQRIFWNEKMSSSYSNRHVQKCQTERLCEILKVIQLWLNFLQQRNFN